ncbi:hypothetical protein FB451DRAFT_1422497 [Mycena latifolia]|nr:hypothetical protein FB451DRAFT_1422497 [Mycena latifolia]
MASKGGKIVYTPGDLVQVLDPKYRKTFLTAKKILPEWSGALRVKERRLNSYILETIYGQKLDGDYSGRRLRPFVVPQGSSLEAYEKDRANGTLPGGAVDGTSHEPLAFEEPEPTKTEGPLEEGLRSEEEVEEAEEDWVDEEEGNSIGESRQRIPRPTPTFDISTYLGRQAKTSMSGAPPNPLSPSPAVNGAAAAAVPLVPTNTVTTAAGLTVRTRIDPVLSVDDVVRQLCINLKIKEPPSNFALRDETDELVTNVNLRRQIKTKVNLK